MNNTALIIVVLVVLGGGYLFAQSKFEKTDSGFTFREGTVRTYYVNRIVWGDNYVDHDDTTPVHNTEVIAFGDGWEYSTTTDDNGEFKVEVKPDVPFKIKASDGNRWSESEELTGVPKGTIKVDKT